MERGERDGAVAGAVFYHGHHRLIGLASPALFSLDSFASRRDAYPRRWSFAPIKIRTNDTRRDHDRSPIGNGWISRRNERVQGENPVLSVAISPPLSPLMLL